MRLRKLKRLLKPESLGGEPTDEDLGPAIEAVEQSKLALEQAEEKAEAADQITARARRIEQRNGFGQLAEKLLIDRERERRRHLGHGHGGVV